MARDAMGVPEVEWGDEWGEQRHERNGSTRLQPVDAPLCRNGLSHLGTLSVPCAAAPRARRGASLLLACADFLVVVVGP